MLTMVRVLIAPMCSLLAACDSTQSCARAMLAPARSLCRRRQHRYHGHFYVQWSDKMSAPRGSRLGAAVFPACNDTGNCRSEDRDIPTRVWALRGVDPAIALVGRGQGSGKLVVYGRLGARPSEYFKLTKNGEWRVRR